MKRGEIYWVDFGDPRGSEPGYLRPVLIAQADSFNDSKIATTVGISLTSNLKYRALPGCIFLSAGESGLPKDSIINLTQIQTVNKDEIGELIGQVPDELMAAIDFALMEVLGLS